jgi:ABC-type uncharacterized transport system permease subunit
MIDSNPKNPHFPSFLRGRSERDMIVYATAMSLGAAFGIWKLTSLLYLNHKLLPLLAPILVIVPIYLAWYAFRTVRAILSAHAQRGAGEPLQPVAFDSLRRYAETVSIFAVIEWLVVIAIIHSSPRPCG